MSERKGHYLKPAKKLGVPGVVFALVPHPWHHSERYARHIDVQTWMSAEVCVSYRRGAKWSAPLSAVVETGDDLRAWMDTHAERGRTNWVISPSASETLTLSQWWDYADERGVRFAGGAPRKCAAGDTDGPVAGIVISQICLSGPPDILTYSECGVRWRWVSATNYWPDGAPVGTGDARGQGETGEGRRIADAEDSGVRDAECRALLSRFRGLCRWWSRVATAPLGCTAGALAYGVLRSHAPARSLCTHTDDDAHRLERSAAHGGRASVWYVGRVGGDPGRADRCAGADGAYDSRHVPGPVTHVDVSSMYPTLLRDELYPVKLSCYYRDMRPADLIDLARSQGVIARVTVRSRVGEYPLRRENDTIYPIGEFTTVLAGPDILSFGDDCDILKVREVSTYALERPFADAMSRLLQERSRATGTDEVDTRALSKLVANSLAGKLAQREGGWMRRSAMDEPRKWGEEHAFSTGGGHLARFRWIAGIAWEWCQSKLPRGPHTSAFAYLTAHGRQMMRRIRAHCPASSVVSQDTDGLYLLPAGILALGSAGMLAREGPGLLRVTASADSGQWIGPRHYRFGSRWVLAGFAEPDVDPVALTVAYSSHTPMFGAKCNAPPSSVYTVRGRTAIPSDLQQGRVRSDGWIDPPHLLPRKRYAEDE